MLVKYYNSARLEVLKLDALQGLPCQFRSLEQGVPSQHGVLETDPFGDASFGGNSSCHGESQVTMWWIFQRALRTPEGIDIDRYMHLEGLVFRGFFVQSWVDITLSNYLLIYR